MSYERMLFLKQEHKIGTVVRIQRPTDYDVEGLIYARTYSDITVASAHRLEYILRRAAIVRHVILTSAIYIYAHFIARLPDEPPERMIAVKEFDRPLATFDL